MRNILVNLQVADVAVSRDFFGKLGFEIDEQFSDDNVVCVVIEQNIRAVLMAPDRFGEFTRGEVVDARKATEVLLCLTADSRQEVDDMASAAESNGGSVWQDPVDETFMYARSFADPDGHVWEVMHLAAA